MLWYGSAEVAGTVWHDYVCLNSLQNEEEEDDDEEDLDELLEASSCAPFSFLAARYVIGLEPWIDGILGLSPNYMPEYDEEHFLPAMRDAGVID